MSVHVILLKGFVLFLLIPKILFALIFSLWDSPCPAPVSCSCVRFPAREGQSPLTASQTLRGKAPQIRLAAARPRGQEAQARWGPAWGPLRQAPAPYTGTPRFGAVASLGLFFGTLFLNYFKSEYSAEVVQKAFDKTQLRLVLPSLWPFHFTRLPPCWACPGARPGCLRAPRGCRRAPSLPRAPWPRCPR